MNKLIDDIVRAVLNIENDVEEMGYVCVGCGKITKNERVFNVCDRCEEYFCEGCMDSFGQLCQKCIENLYDPEELKQEYNL